MSVLGSPEADVLYWGFQLKIVATQVASAYAYKGMCFILATDY